MKHFNNLILRPGIFLLMFAIVFSSCIPMKRIEYLQQEVSRHDTLRTHFKKNVDLANYQIQPGDNLYIKVRSVLSGSDNIFNQEDMSRSSNYYNDAGIYLNSYEVNEQGYIDFPFVGSVYVKDLTVDQARELIKGIVRDYIKEATVIVKLAIFKVTVLGEVNRPGNLNVYQNRLTIFELIAMAGDLSNFAKRDKIYLVRETQTGTKIEKINLNDADVLRSEYYYIQPNDIVYVPPVSGKNFAFSQFPYTLVFSTISTTLLLINFFQSN